MECKLSSRPEPHKNKNIVRRMFTEIEKDQLNLVFASSKQQREII